MLSQFCLKLMIGNVHNLSLYENEKKFCQEIENQKKQPKIKICYIFNTKEIFFNFEQ